jgi:hypothetical protein
VTIVPDDTLADGVIGRSAVNELIDVIGSITTLPRIDDLIRAIVPDALRLKRGAHHA